MRYKIISVVFFITLFNTSFGQLSFESSIDFFGYSDTSKNFVSTFNNSLQDFGCDPNGLWAVIVHGWLESTNHTTWIPDLIGNLTKYRGGCIIAMNYFDYSKNPDYFGMYNQFEQISAVLLKKLNQILGEGFKPENGYLFGFSFGAHLVYDVGIKTGGQIAKIDTCDPAGVGFDGTTKWRDPKISGKSVQCIHTSLDKGTYTRSCHQNWLMGYCGYSQAAAGGYPMGHHGLCPHFYNTAFTTNFVAERNPDKCTAYIGDVAWCFPSNFKMGYMESRMSQVNGTLFARTFNTLTYGP